MTFPKVTTDICDVILFAYEATMKLGPMLKAGEENVFMHLLDDRLLCIGYFKNMYPPHYFFFYI